MKKSMGAIILTAALGFAFVSFNGNARSGS